MWDIVKIKSLPEDESLLKDFISIAEKNYKININYIETLVIDCSGQHEDYINNLDKKGRKDIRRRYRQMQELGNVSIVEMKNPHEIEDGLKIFYDIEDSGWKGQRGTSLKRSYYGEYFRKLAHHYSKENKFRLYLLKINENYIAGIYTIVDQNIMYNVKTGYHDDYKQYSPSNVLFYLLSEQLFNDEQIKKVDYYGPFLRYERVFGKNTRKRYHITICNKKILPISYYLFLKILKKLNYPFPKGSLREKMFKKLTKTIYN
jgi:CelD/BcsL family acetyltransferase involved in cellulose biosynthesis